jgi:PKD repeat protein
MALSAGANTLPVADAGADQTIYLGEAAVLSGSGSDADGDNILAYEWTIVTSPLGSSPQLLQPQTTTPTLIPDELGDYVISLVVFDGTDSSLPDTVTVSVVQNLPPVAVATSDVTSGAAPLTVAFDGSQSFDPEGAALIVRWDFGDGSPATDEISPVHTYPLPVLYVAE